MKQEINRMGMVFKSMPVLALAVVLAGCGSSVTTPEEAPKATVKAVTYKPNSEAGLPVKGSEDPTAFPKLVASRASSFGAARPDPFALTSIEKQFETEQSTERILSNVGGFSVNVEPKEETDLVPVLEPQPYRRLSGIVVGDSVVAILEMGEGQSAIIVHPGSKIPGTEWTVVSIDQEKAILRRGGNKLPKQIVVRLEVAPAGFGGGNAGFGGGAPGAGNGPRGGFPGPGGPGAGGPGGPSD